MDIGVTTVGISIIESGDELTPNETKSTNADGRKRIQKLFGSKLDATIGETPRNREYLRELYVRNLEKNREYHRKWMREWSKNNLEHVRELGRCWQKTDKGRAAKRRHSAKRRARLAELINDLTAEEWLDILLQFDNKCAYCKEEMLSYFEIQETHPKAITQDHIIPLTRGGNHIKSNIVPACRSCNSKWGNKMEGKMKVLRENWPNLFLEV